MRYDIGTTPADIHVLLRTLRGTHTRSLSDRVTSAAVSLLIVTFAVPSLIRDGLSSPERSERIFLVGFAVLLAVMAAGIVLRSLSRYRIEDSGIAMEHPLDFFSWHLDRSQIGTISLVLESGWTLEISSTLSKKRSLELDGSLRNAFAVLYPELAPYQPTHRDYDRWKWIAIVLAITLALSVLIVVWLTQKGVFYWA